MAGRLTRRLGMREETKDRQLDGSADPSGRFSRGRAAEGPTDLSRSSWLGVLKRSVREFKEDNLTDWAAALTYYGILFDLPGAARAGVRTGADRKLGDAAADRQPRQGCAGSRAGHCYERYQEPAGLAGRGGSDLHHRVARCALVGFRLCGGLYACVQQDLRHRGGPPRLEDGADAGRPHAGAAACWR